MDYILLATIVGMALYLFPDEWIDWILNHTPIIKDHKMLFGVIVFTILFIVLIICSWNMWTWLTPKGQQLFIDVMKWPALLLGIGLIVTVITMIVFFVQIGVPKNEPEPSETKKEQP